jgi:hypothetical protein
MTAEEKPQLQEEQAEELARLQEQIMKMSVSDHLLYMLESLAGLAMRKVGATTESLAERDLDQARLAIDAFKALLQVTEPTRSEQEVTTHRAMLSQLQYLYVSGEQ